MIEVRNLSCRLDGRDILRTVSFTIARGAYTMITGPNGAGKTTLLRCLDGIVADVSGEIRVGGEDLRHMSRRAIAQRIAYIPQTSEIPPFTVLEFVRLARYPFLERFAPFSAGDHDIVARALETTDTDRFAARRLDSLSGGERQRVLVAAALAQEPKIMLLDEPGAFLDYRQRETLADMLRTLHERHGVTIVEVTHDLNYAALHGSQVVALVDGRIAFDGAPRQLMEPERLREIYGIEIQLVRHPRLDLLMAIPGGR